MFYVKNIKHSAKREVQSERSTTIKSRDENVTAKRADFLITLHTVIAITEVMWFS